MSDELLKHYQQELTYIRRQAAQFGEQNPKIAERLKLNRGTGETNDPHVERLIEAFAYLTARIRYKLDDDFPEVTESLLSVLYPHYQVPIPSMSIVQFELDEGQIENTSGVTIPRGSDLNTEPLAEIGQPCQFRTCYPVTLFPIRVSDATITPRPFPAPPIPKTIDMHVKSGLRLVLNCQSEDVRFADLDMDSVRVYLHGSSAYMYRLYELLFNHTLYITFGENHYDLKAVTLDLNALQPVGFEKNESMLDYPARSFLGYQLLTEFFVFPNKFLFFDLVGLKGKMGNIGNQLEIFFYFNRVMDEVAQNLSVEDFRLGCAPVVNLYPHTAEPITLTQNTYEYRLVPEFRQPKLHEVYSINTVSATSETGDEVIEYAPFFSARHTEESNRQKTYWQAVRRPAQPEEDAAPSAADGATDYFLSIVDLNQTPDIPHDWTLTIQTTCFNRDLPRQLPFGLTPLVVRLVKGTALVNQGVCLTRPTGVLRPAAKQGLLWRLISHLSLNHLSLVNSTGKDGSEVLALREILKLYNFTQSEGIDKIINGITNVSSKPSVARTTRDGQTAICRGVDVTLEFNEANYTGSGLFLFACVLERFLGLYVTVNSYSRMIAKHSGKANDKDAEFRRWPPRVGEKVLL